MSGKKKRLIPKHSMKRINALTAQVLAQMEEFNTAYEKKYSLLKEIYDNTIKEKGDPENHEQLD